MVSKSTHGRNEVNANIAVIYSRAAKQEQEHTSDFNILLLIVEYFRMCTVSWYAYLGGCALLRGSFEHIAPNTHILRTHTPSPGRHNKSEWSKALNAHTVTSSHVAVVDRGCVNGKLNRFFLAFFFSVRNPRPFFFSFCFVSESKAGK